MGSFLSPPFIISILIALSVHEWAHGFIANRLGDPTAEQEGRLTLNPIAHLDPIGTILFILVGFGWGKPVPIDPRYFKHPKRDAALTALAGPVSNLILAFLFFGILMMVAPGSLGTSPMALVTGGSMSSVAQVIAQICKTSIFLNLGLMAFNLLPIAPLDGSKILAAFIPYRHEYQYHVFMERGPYILLFLLIAERVLGISILFAWIFSVMSPFLFVMDKVASLMSY